MKLLFISKFFYPEKAIAAVRPTKLAKYLYEKFKCEIDLLYLGNENIDVADCAFLNKIIRMPTSKCLTRKVLEYLLRRRAHATASSDLNSSKRDKDSSRKKSLFNRLFYRLNFHAYKADGYKTLRRFNRALLKKIDFSDYDIIWSTFGPIETHLIAESIKRKYGKKWIADFRDALYTPNTPEQYYNFCVKYARNVERKADAITYVSRGCGQGLNFVDYEHNKYVLYNGYDPNDFDACEAKKFDKFTVSFTGQIYGVYTFAPILEVIDELSQQKHIDKADIEILYAGPNGNKLLSECKMYNLQNNYRDIGYVSKKESINMQLSSHCLLLPSWNYTYSQGILSGKFYEYMYSGTPIVSIIVGDVANSELKEIIDRYNLGFCYEQTTADSDKVLLKEFILNCYMKYKTERDGLSSTKEGIHVFEYSELANELFDICKNILS